MFADKIRFDVDITVVEVSNLVNGKFVESILAIFDSTWRIFSKLF